MKNDYLTNYPLIWKKKDFYISNYYKFKSVEHVEYKKLRFTKKNCFNRKLIGWKNV